MKMCLWEVEYKQRFNMSSILCDLVSNYKIPDDNGLIYFKDQGELNKVIEEVKYNDKLSNKEQVLLVCFLKQIKFGVFYRIEFLLKKDAKVNALSGTYKNDLI